MESEWYFSIWIFHIIKQQYKKVIFKPFNDMANNVDHLKSISNFAFFVY